MHFHLFTKESTGLCALIENGRSWKAGDEVEVGMRNVLHEKALNCA